MMDGLRVDIGHITRVEGHGNVLVEVEGGRVKTARLDIDESPRYFEAMMLGRPYVDAAVIAPRICGICAVAHTTASLKATEAAFGITPSDQTVRLRRLMYLGEIIQSHVLHVCFLALPDLFGAGSVIPLAATHPETVRAALRLKGLANDLCAVVGGRHVHPIALAVNGFTSLPDAGELERLHVRLTDARTDLDGLVGLIKGLGLPRFERETEYVSLKGMDSYPFIEGDIVSSHGRTVSPADYGELMIETVLPTSTAKHVATNDGPFMVGALARFNNNHGLLHPRAIDAADDLGLSAPCHNPYMINAAQIVETVHSLEEAITLTGSILDAGLTDEPRDVKPVEGRGVGVVEAPRGLLIHDYEYGPDGRLTGANCIIPTGQNVANIEADMRELAPSLLAVDRSEAELMLKMLVRAYDPCISCATHSIEVKFVVHP